MCVGGRQSELALAPRFLFPLTKPIQLLDCQTVDPPGNKKKKVLEPKPADCEGKEEEKGVQQNSDLSGARRGAL